MAISYTIVIRDALVTTQGDLTNVIKEVNIEITGKDGECQFSLPTTIQFGPANPEDFTPFNELTQEQLLSWIESQESLESVKAHIALVVAKEVEKASLEQKPLPWQITE